jgi:hypothetical protein
MIRGLRLATLFMLLPLWVLPLSQGEVTRATSVPASQEQISTAGRCADLRLNPWSDGEGSSTLTKPIERESAFRPGHRTWGSVWVPRQWSAAGTASCVAAPEPEPPIDAILEDPAQQLIFGDDFETTDDLRRWNGQRGMTIQDDDAFGGDQAARALTTDNPRVVQQRFDRTYREVHYRIRFKILSQGSNSVNLLRFRTSYNDAIIGLFVSSEGRLGVRNDLIGDSTSSPTLVTPGEWHEIQVRLRIDGRDGAIEVWFDGERIDRLSRTGWFGLVQIGRIDLGDNMGERRFDVLFDDVAVAESFIGSNAIPDPISGTLTVQTVPRMEGVVFEFEGNRFVSDSKGVATLKVIQWSSDLRSRIVVPDVDVPCYTGATFDDRPTWNGLAAKQASYTDPDCRVNARFSRWYGWSDDPGASVYALMDTWVPISWSFKDLSGQPVDPALVTSINFKSSTGIKLDFTADKHGAVVWVHSGRVVPSQDGLLPKVLYYTVETAYVGGSNVVIRARDKFFPHETRHWDVTLLFYSATFRARDAFFGFPIGSTVNIIAPDGTVIKQDLDSNSEITLPKLPRGEYQVSVIGPGYSPLRPVAVSKNQDVEIQVFTYLDMAVVFVVLSSIGFGLILLGRPFLLSPRYWRRYLRFSDAWQRVRRGSL